jgi:DNA-binding MurR/RpiR family transcriptional regulator
MKVNERTSMNETDNPGVDFDQNVANHYASLTKSEKRIADFLRRNRDDAAFYSAGEIAQQLDLSEATMVRFARSLGYASYPAMRDTLQDKFRSLLTHSMRIRSRLENLREAGDIFERLVASEITFLTEAIQTLDRKALNAAVELIRTHQRVFVFGMGPSNSLVDLLEIRLTRSARHVIPLRTSGQELLEALLLMKKEDLLIAIGFFKVNPALQMVLEHANKHETPVIFVTDTLGPLLGDKATVVLAARRGPVSSFHSLTIPMTIINTLLLALSSVDQENVLGTLDKLDNLRDRFRRHNGS